jgi:aspartate-semialdehyde dehydrogenase
MVLVEKDYRGMGVGKMLILNLLNQLHSFQSVKLDATPAGQPLYEKFGFKNEYLIHRMTTPSLDNFQPFISSTISKPILISDILGISALDASIAGKVEEQFAKKGHIVISNSKNHRWDKFVPLLIPEVNYDHLRLVKYQKYNGGAIVTNPNCSTIGLVLALKPLVDSFGISDINVVTMQALSGAGYPGVSSLDILDNVIPYIGGEEEKLESEPKKIFGKFTKSGVSLSRIKISAQTHRVAVKDGHLEAVQINLKKKVDAKDIINVWNRFSSLPQKLKLHSAPVKPIHYFEESNYPQPRLHRDIDKGMAVSVGRLRKCNLFDYKFEVLSHNTVRGAAGGAILCGELMLAKNMI